MMSLAQDEFEQSLLLGSADTCAKTIDFLREQLASAITQRKEERARRLELEEELAASNKAFREQRVVVRYRERRVYKPMPPTIQRVLVPVEVPGEVVRVRELVPRPAPGFLGRLGDRIDAFFRRR